MPPLPRARRTAHARLASACVAALGAWAGLLGPGDGVVHAADFWWAGDVGPTWNTGAGGNTNFSTSGASNVNSTVLPGPADVVRFSVPGAGNLATTLGQNFSLLGLRLEPGAAATSISGNTLTLGSGGLTNASTATLTLNSALVTSAPSYTFDLSGGGGVTVGSNLSGDGIGLTKTGPGTLVLNGANSFTGPTVINGGTLVTGIVDTFSSASSVTVNSGGTLRFGADDLWGNFQTGSTSVVTINAGGTVTSNNNFTTLINPVLNGGTLACNGGANINLPAFALQGTITVGGTQTSNITSGTGGLNAINVGTTGGGTTAFSVADATASPAADLVIAVPLHNNFNGFGAVLTGITKTGPGTLALTGASTYGGSTLVSAGTLQLGNGGTTGSLSSNTAISVAAGAFLAINRSDDLTFSAPFFSGLGGFVQAGASTVTFTGDTAMALGPIVVSAGTLRLGNGGTTGSLGNTSGATVAAGGALAVNRSDNLTYTAPLFSGAGAFIQAGPNTVTFNGTQTYTGPTVVSAGTLQIGNGGTAGALAPSSVITVAAAGTLVINLSDALVFSNALSGSGTVVKPFANVLTLAADSPFTGNFNVNAGSLVVGEGGALAANVVLAAGTSLMFSRSGASTFSGNATGPGQVLVQAPAGTVSFTGTSTHTGPTTVTAGTLQIGNGGTTGAITGTPGVSVSTGAALAVNRSDDPGFALPVTGTGSFVKLGPATLTLTTSLPASITTIVSGGTLSVGDGTTSGSIAGDVVLSAGTSLTFNRSSNITYAGVISGAGQLVHQTSNRTLVLTGSNTYSGGTVISNGGTVQIGNGGTSGAIAGTGPVSLSSGGTLSFARSNDITLSSPVSGSGNLRNLSEGTLTLTSTVGSGVTTTINSGTLRVGDGVSGGTISGPVVNNGVLVLSGAGGVSGRVSGAGPILKLGTSSLSLFLSFTQSGPISVVGGTLSIGTDVSDINLPNTPSIYVGPGARLNFPGSNNFGRHIAQVTPAVTVAAGGTMSSSNSFNTLVNLTLSGGTVLINGGQTSLYPGFGLKGTLTVNGFQPSTIVGGTGNNIAVNIGPSDAAGSLIIRVADVTASPDPDLTISVPLWNNKADLSPGTALPSGLTKTGPGTLVLTGANTFTGPTVINGGTLVTGTVGTYSPLSTVTVNSGGTLRFGADDLWGNFQTASTSLVTINAGGTVTSSNSFTTLINLTLNGGTLACNGGANANLPAFALQGTVTVGGTQPSNIVAGTGTLNVINVGSPGGNDTTFAVADVTSNPAADLTIAVPLQNNFIGTGQIGTGIRKTGPGTLLLTATNPYSSATSVDAGTLQIGGGGTSGSIPNTFIAILASGGRLAFNRSDTLTVPTEIIGSGTVHQLGPGTLVLTGNSTYTGSTAVLSGTLQIGNGGTTGSIVGNVLVNGAIVFARATSSSFPAVGNVEGSGTLSVSSGRATTARIRVAGLSVAAGQRLTVLAGSGLSNVSSLSLGTGATLDLNNNSLIVRNGDPAALRAAVASWWNNGARNGPGLASSVAGTGTGRDAFAKLAVFPNDSGSGFPDRTTFGGLSVSASDVLVMYTYLGDTNLDGLLDARDLSRILNGWSNGLTGWRNGDINYDGIVNAADFSLFLPAYNAYAGGGLLPFSPDPGPGAAIPEPATLAGLLPAAMLLTRRRRSRVA